MLQARFSSGIAYRCYIEIIFLVILGGRKLFAKKAQVIKRVIILLGGRFLLIKDATTWLMVSSIVLGVYLLSSTFLSFDNMSVLLDVTPELGIVVVGVTMLMISGEFDLSVGSIFAFCPTILIIMIASGWNIWLATILSLLACCMIGALHAIITLRIGIPSFITTLGGMMLWRGVVLVLTGGFPPPFPKEAFPLRELVVGYIGPIRLSFVYFIALVLILWIILERTQWGNWIFATGGNPEATLSRGINPKTVKLVSFMFTSFLAGFSGIIQAFRITAILPNAGTGLELNAIAGAVIGGTQLAGGAGSITGAAIGAFLVRMLNNALISVGIPGYWFRVFLGIFIIGAVVLNVFFGKLRIKFSTKRELEIRRIEK